MLWQEEMHTHILSHIHACVYMQTHGHRERKLVSRDGSMTRKMSNDPTVNSDSNMSGAVEGEEMEGSEPWACVTGVLCGQRGGEPVSLKKCC